MDPDRRTVIAGMGAISLVGCKGEPPTEPVGPAPDRAPEPAAWTGLAPEDGAAFAWGVQAGDAGVDSVVIGVRTLEKAVELVVVGAEGDGWVEVARHPGLILPAEGVVKVRLTELQPDRPYRYQFLSADGSRGSAVGRFRTSGLGAPRKVVFGASSCFGGEDPEYPSIAFAAAEELDFFVLLGDSVYADGSVSSESYRAHWRTWNAKANIRALTASTSLVATWDDHEVGNNWFVSPQDVPDAVNTEQVENGTAMFREALPMGPEPDEPLWRSLVWGELVELIVLDCRSERNWVDEMVSPAQLAWATERIRTSTARFKIVLTSVHVTDHAALLQDIEADDRWQGYPAQREALVQAATEVPGVLFVTGDMHFGAVQRLSPPGQLGDGLFEVAAGPSGSLLFPLPTLVGLATEEAAVQYEDLVEDWTWARFELDPNLGTIRVQLIDDRGDAVVDRVLTFDSA